VAHPARHRLPNGAILLVPQALADGAWDKPISIRSRNSSAQSRPNTSRRGPSASDSPAAPTTSSGSRSPSPNCCTARSLRRRLPRTRSGQRDPQEAALLCHPRRRRRHRPFEEGQKAFAALEAKKVLCKFEKVAGLKHTVDWDALKRGVGWIGGILDERDKAAENEIAAKITALEAALKEKSWEAAAQGFAGLAKVPRALAPKLAALAKPHVMSANEPLALAAIEASGRCGADGVPALKSIPVTNLKLATAAATALGATGAPTAVDPLLVFLKASKEAVSIAAAESLGRLGGDAATKALVAGLATTRAAPPRTAARPPCSLRSRPSPARRS